MSSAPSLGASIFHAVRLLDDAGKEIDAMMHQVDRMLTQQCTPKDEEIREIYHCYTDELVSTSQYVTEGVVYNYGMRAKGEAKKSEPAHVLAIYVQLGHTHVDSDHDPLLIHQPLVHIHYNSGGPWNENYEPVVLSSDNLIGDGWHLMTDALWAYTSDDTDDGSVGWLYTIPLTSLNSLQDLQRNLIEPFQALMTGRDKLPTGDDAYAALGAKDDVIRYRLDGDRVLVTAPQSVRTETP